MRTIRVLLAAGVFAVAAGAYAADAPTWPAGVMNKDDPRIQSFYEGMCDRYAEQADIQDGDRDAYLAQCRERIAKVFPVGYAKGGGGGGE